MSVAPSKTEDVYKKRLSGPNSLPGASWLLKLHMLQSMKYDSDVTQSVQDTAKWGTWTGPDCFGVLAKESDPGFPSSAVFRHCPVQWQTHSLEAPLQTVVWVQKMVVYASEVLVWPHSFGLHVESVHTRIQTLCRTNFLWLPQFPAVSAWFTRSMDVNGSFIQELCWVKGFTQWRYGSFLVMY